MSSSTSDEMSSVKGESRVLKAQLREARQTIHALKASARAQQHRQLKGTTVLSSDVLWQILPGRVAALGARSRLTDVEAATREFCARSDSYRTVRALGDRLLDGIECEQVEIAGLHWCVPKEPEGSESSLHTRMLRRGWLPLAEILAARDLAVGHTMLDIGANIGTTSIPRVALGDFRRIYAAEPEPTNYACLVENVVANRVDGSVLADRVAISDADGEAELLVRTSRPGHYLRGSRVDLGLDSVITVPCRTLDTWVSEMDIDLDAVTFIKLDTQGAEGAILRGARAVLARKHIAWQIELWPFGLQRIGFELRELVDLLQSSFTHAIDLRRRRFGAAAQSTAELPEMIAYLKLETRDFTDLLLYNASDGWTLPRSPSGRP